MPQTIAKLPILLRCLIALVFTTLATSLAWAEGLLFSVQKGDAAPSYMMGTMHTEDPRVLAQMTRVEPLIQQVDIVALELVPDGVTTVAIGMASLLPADQRLRDLIGDARFEALGTAAHQQGVPMALLDRMKPWAAAITLSMPPAESGRFLDMEIYLRALAFEREVVGLESAAQQLGIFNNMSTELQLELLDTMIKDYRELPKQMEQLTHVYLAGDLAALDQVARQQYDTMSPDATRWFDEELLLQRNRLMVRRAKELMAGKRVLIAVGAMHLAGDNGLVAGLRAAGYRVERLQE